MLLFFSLGSSVALACSTAFFSLGSSVITLASPPAFCGGLSPRWRSAFCCFCGGLSQVFFSLEFSHSVLQSRVLLLRLCPSEVNVAPEVEVLAWAAKARRVDTYKQLQAIAALVFDTTGVPLDTFAVPDSWIVRRLRPGEERGHDAKGAFLKTQSSVCHELPEQLRVSDVPLLVLCLDQGSPGLAGGHFAQGRLGLNLFVFPDAFHRGPNDVKDACNNSCGAVFRRVMLHSTFIQNLNYGPFGSGTWFQEKRELLKRFLENESPQSPIFEKYVEKIALGLGLPCGCQEEVERLWEALSELNSFVRKGPLVKGSRWFSWWDNYVFHRPEYHAYIMLLEWRRSRRASAPAAVDGAGGMSSHDPKLVGVKGGVDAEFRALRSSCTGFDLAERVLTDELSEQTALLFAMSRPVWTYHSARARDIQSPTEALRLYVRLARGAWKDEEIADIVRASFHDATLLRSVADSDQVDLVKDFAIALLGNRAWSYSFYSEVPPLACAAAMSTSRDVREAALSEMQLQWANLLRLERAALFSQDAKELRDDIHWADHVPIRLLFMFFERDGWSPNSILGQRFLRALLQHLPDSRIVEQTHRYVRLDCEGRRANNNRSNRFSRLVASVDNPVVRQHRVQEVCVDKRVFLRRFHDVAVPKLSRRSFEAAADALPPRWGEVMRPTRTWSSPTPLSSRGSVAAWRWLHHFFAEALPQGARIFDGWLAGLFVPGAVVRRVDNGSLWLVLATTTWAAWALPLRVAGEPAGGVTPVADAASGGVTPVAEVADGAVTSVADAAVFEVRQGCELLFCWRLGQWEVLPCRAAVADCRGCERLLLFRTGPSLSFAAYGVRHGTLTIAPLRKLAKLLELPLRKQATKAQLLEATPPACATRLQCCSNFYHKDAALLTTTHPASRGYLSPRLRRHGCGVRRLRRSRCGEPDARTAQGARGQSSRTGSTSSDSH